MAKTNFTKVEESLKSGMEKIKISNLGKMADIAQEAASKPEMKGLMEKAALVASKMSIERKATLHIIEQALNDYPDDAFFQLIDCNRQQIVELINRKESLKRNEWETLRQVKIKITDFKNTKLQKNSEKANEKLIDSERQRHKNKRFNVREKWLPLK